MNLKFNKGGASEGSMTRTQNQKCKNDYTFFKECIKMSLRAGTDAMITNYINIAYFSRISTNIYAGHYRNDIEKDFDDILEEILDEPYGSGYESEDVKSIWGFEEVVEEKRRKYFKAIYNILLK